VSSPSEPTAAGTPRPALRLPRERRLLRKVDYEAVYARGRRFGDNLFGVHYLQREPPGPPRIGLSVGLKAAGGGVRRNRIRRVVRESFRLVQHRLGGLDVVVTARGGVRLAPDAAVRSSLDAVWSKLARQCGASSRT
jgi:ribonuclease P protein component